MAQKAVFDHVDDDGVVILRIGDEKVELDDSDDFEQGLLAAKQIKAEARTDTLPPETAGLPISQIQNLARAGVTTDKIAAKYGMDPALIRRFAEPIEQEKKSAIAQFLTVNIRQNEEVHRLGELINSTLVAAGVDTASVEWTASRNRREPWRISALFPHNSRIYKATWSWNMRDNAVVAIDPTAKKLLGQSDADARDLLFGDEGNMSISTDVPQSGPNPPSWMIEGGHRHGEDSRSAQNDAGEDDTRLFRPFAGEGSQGSDESSEETRTLSPLTASHRSSQTGPQTGGTLDRAGQTHADANSLSGVSGDHQQEETAHQPSAVTNGPSHDGQNGTDDTVADSSHSTDSTRPDGPDGDTDSTDRHDGQEPDRPSRRNSRSKTRRNAIPSWDDIIFGD